MRLPRTPSQTVGPYFAIALPWADGPFAVADGTPGAIWIRGRVFDGAGEPVTDALIETWQPPPHGPPVAGFRGFARSATDGVGRWAVLTLKPRAAPNEAPSIDLLVFARGLLKPIATRVYFADEVAANAADPVLGAIGDAQQRASLVAERCPDGYRFDIHLQGPNETAFFDV
jgi:protocatechuate 3,4-dioxygenase alpha subunit